MVAVAIITEKCHVIQELFQRLVGPLGVPPVNCLHVDWSLDRGIVVGGRGRWEELECRPQILTPTLLQFIAHRIYVHKCKI